MRYFNRKEVKNLNLVTESELDEDFEGKDWKNNECVHFEGILLDEDCCENVYDISLMPLFDVANKRIFCLEEILALELVTEHEVNILPPGKQLDEKLKVVGSAFVDGDFQNVYQVLNVDLKYLLLHKSPMRNKMWQQIGKDF